MLTLTDGAGIIKGAGKELWLPFSELPVGFGKPHTIRFGELFFDVVGFSESRQCFLIEPIKIDGAADNIEAELDGEQ